MRFGPVIKALNKTWKNLITGIFPTENTFCWIIPILVLGQSSDLVLILKEIPPLESIPFRCYKVSPVMGIQRQITESRKFLDSHFLILRVPWPITALNQHTSDIVYKKRKYLTTFTGSAMGAPKNEKPPNTPGLFGSFEPRPGCSHNAWAVCSAVDPSLSKE